jgi:two-component system NtrC family sensor kinase
MPLVTPPPDHHMTLNRLATIARLVAGAAHEVNNALQVIGGSVELLQNRTDLPDAVQKILTRVSEQTARAAGAMTGVVTLSRSQPDAFYQVDLREVASRAVGMRQYSIARADLAVKLELPAHAQIVQGHSMHLLQAVLNLIQNAEQALASRRGGRIDVEVVDDGAHVVLRVSDDGPGIQAADADAIFQPFVTSQPRPESTGLGLSVARGIAEAHGGSLQLEPSPRGAAFTLRLPRRVS